MSKRTYRQEGYLKHMSQQGSPSKIIAFDTETDFIENDSGAIKFPFKLGYAIYYRLDKQGNIKSQEGHVIGGGQDFFKFIESYMNNKDKIYVFAHNIAFDLRVLDMFHLANKRGYHSDPPIINNMVFIWSIKKAKRTIVFVDSSNLGVHNIKQLGHDMGYDKMEIDFDNTSYEYLLEYCIRDVEIVGRFVIEYIQFLRKYNLGNFKLTLASQSLQAYRTKFNNTDIFIHMWLDAIILERDAYYGGRTECFKLGYIGEQDYYYLDVNSMYPYVMTEYDLPVKLIKRFKNPTIEDIIDNSEYYLIADVTLNTQDNVYPFRVDTNKKTYNHLNNPSDITNYPELKHRRLIFPIGTFRTTLHDIEIEHAMNNEDIIKVHRLFVYERGRPFADYVNFFYEKKKQYTLEQNKSWRLVSKLFLNSLYGKFGQLLSHREKLLTTETYDILRETVYNIDNGDRFSILYWFGNAIKEYKRGETAFSSPAIAGAITAYARYLLYSYIQIAGKENVYYTDTDSLMTNVEGYKNLKFVLDDYELGKLSLEHTSRRLIIYGNKDYRFDDIVRFKGLPKTAEKIRHNLWSYIQFEGFLSWFNRGGSKGMIGERRTKRRLGEYHKGIVQDDNSILPYHLYET